jgi:hypothetical protein
MFGFLKNHKRKIKCLSAKYYYETLLNFRISRDPITGIYGMDINPAFAMIAWVIPGSSAENMGLFPRDLIYAIDGIIVNPGDTWYQKYLLYRNEIVITIIPTNRYFDKPKLEKRLMRINTRMGNIITRDRTYHYTLSLQKKGKKLDKLKIEPTFIPDHHSNYEVKMTDSVYI